MRRTQLANQYVVISELWRNHHDGTTYRVSTDTIYCGDHDDAQAIFNCLHNHYHRDYRREVIICVELFVAGRNRPVHVPVADVARVAQGIKDDCDFVRVDTDDDEVAPHVHFK